MTMTKTQITDAVQRNAHMSKNKAVKVTEHLLETIKSSLASEDDILIGTLGMANQDSINIRKSYLPFHRRNNADR